MEADADAGVDAGVRGGLAADGHAGTCDENCEQG
jgi:hypothetical protein